MLITAIDQNPRTLHASNSKSLPLSNNKLLSALPIEDFARLSSSFVSVPFRSKQRVHRQGEAVHHVYFPTGGALSLIKTLSDGQSAEIATIGNEGMIGVHVFFGEVHAPGSALVHVANGEFCAMAVEEFNAEMSRRGPFYNLMMRYCVALTNQIMQTSVCNSLHSVEQRARRWLLLTHDRVGMDEFPLTHDLLAEMLGVRRPTVTLIAGNLQRAGLVGFRRGYATILDRDGLEAASCECYAGVKASFLRLFPQRLGSN